MKILVCGCRDWTDGAKIEEEMCNYANLAHQAVESLVVISGGAKGADSIAAKLAKSWKWHLRVFLADWDSHGRAAGVMRNQKMLDVECPDQVLAFWDGRSKGTLDMISRAVRYGVEVSIVPMNGRKTP